MSLPKTLRHAEEKIYEAEGLFQLHSDELVEALTSGTEYKGLQEDNLVKNMVSAAQAASNAEAQFFNYETDLNQVLESGKDPGEFSLEHDMPPNLQEYQKAYKSTASLINRYDRLDRQFKALSKVMEQNGMGNLRERMVAEHPWYREPTEASNFENASNL